MHRRHATTGGNVLFDAGRASAQERPPVAAAAAAAGPYGAPDAAPLDFVAPTFVPAAPVAGAAPAPAAAAVAAAQQAGGGFATSFHTHTAPVPGPAPSDGFIHDASHTTFDDEPPLLEELGIDPAKIWHKTKTVLNPLRPVEPVVVSDNDLAGPLFFVLILAALLLLCGKMHFGYLYGLGALGCGALYLLLNLMGSSEAITLDRTISVLGYCLLPMVILTFAAVFISLRNWFGLILAGGCIVWCTHMASLMFVHLLAAHEQRLLIAYPVGLLYTVFALITVF